MSILFYQKPEYIGKESELSQSSCQKYVERASCSRAAIPSELSFDNLIEGRSLPPCTLQDFLDYLVYVSHDAENLQFFLWLRDYTSRFDALPADVKSLSQPWHQPALYPNIVRTDTNTTAVDTAQQQQQQQEDRQQLPVSPCPASNPASPRTPNPSTMKPLPRTPIVPLSKFSTKLPSPTVDFHRWGTYDTEPLVLKEFSSRLSMDTTVRSPSPPPRPSAKAAAAQPFRQEIDQISSHYLVSGAPRELNLSAKDRRLALQALDHTTHPSALAAVGRMCEQALRHHSHRNFVRWSICNGNKPRVLVLRGIAFAVLTITLALTVFLILSGRSRWFRLCLVPALYFGVVNLIAARQGLCVLLHRRHTRERRPWEIDEFADKTTSGSTHQRQASSFSTNQSPTNTREGPGAGASVGSEDRSSGNNDTSEVTPWDAAPSDGGEDGQPAIEEKAARKQRLAAFGGKNSYEHESWVRRWEQRGPWRKIRIQKVRIADNGGLRTIQNRIVWQAEAWGLLVTIAVMAGVVAFPQFGLYLGEYRV